LNAYFIGSLNLFILVRYSINKARFIKQLFFYFD